MQPVKPSVAAIQSASQPVEPAPAPAPATEFSPEAITVMDQRAVENETGRYVELQVKAPADTRFRIGTAGQDTGSIPCAGKVLDGAELLYQVSCPAQEPKRKLYAIITLGGFDYGFTKPLR